MRGGSHPAAGSHRAEREQAVVVPAARDLPASWCIFTGCCLTALLKSGRATAGRIALGLVELSCGTAKSGVPVGKDGKDGKRGKGGKHGKGGSAARAASASRAAKAASAASTASAAEVSTPERPRSWRTRPRWR